MKLTFILSFVVLLSSSLKESKKKIGNYSFKNDTIAENLELFSDSSFLHKYKIGKNKLVKTRGFYFGDSTILILEVPVGTKKKPCSLLSEAYNIRNDTLIHILEEYRQLTPTDLKYKKI